MPLKQHAARVINSCRGNFGISVGNQQNVLEE